MSFIDVIYQPFNTQQGKLTILMVNGLPTITEDAQVILANLSTLSAATTQNELPQNTEFGILSTDKINILVTNIDRSRAAKASIIQKIAKDTAGSVKDTPGLEDFTKGVDMKTAIEGGTTSG